MKICFIDEAGDLGPLRDPPNRNDQPALVICGLFVDSRNLDDITGEFLELKQECFPRLFRSCRGHSDLILAEVKGSYLRRNATSQTSREYRPVIRFLDRIFDLLRRHDVKMAAHILIKALGGQFNGTADYTSSIQSICSYFEQYLTANKSVGFCIADSRNPTENSRVSHSIFKQKFDAKNRYPHIVEVPTFGHSENHVGLQICDIVCSALLYPIACFAYCTGHVENVHVQPRADRLRRRYGQRLQAMQHQYIDPKTNRQEDRIVVDDRLGHRSGSLMFRPQ